MSEQNPSIKNAEVRSTSNTQLYMLGCFVFGAFSLLTFLGGVFVGSRYFPQNGGNGGNGDTTQETTTIASGDNDDEERYFTVTSPVEDESLNGKILVEGEATVAFEELTIKLYDDDWNVLATSYAGFTGSIGVEDWSTYLHVVNSPRTLNGNLRVFPALDGEDSKRTQTIPVSFQQQDTPGRVILYTPLYLQTMEGENVYFKGQMKDFPEGIVGLRLLDDTERVLIEDTISATGNNMGQYAQFAKLVELTRIPQEGGNGNWELYEIDSEGEFTELILTIPVLF